MAKDLIDHPEKEFFNCFVHMSLQMFQYLLSCGADLNKTDINKREIFYFINRIKNPKIIHSINIRR